MSPLSTHVLDISSGRPAVGIRVRLYEGEAQINSALTDGDGRCLSLLPKDTSLTLGTYRLVFEVSEYFPGGFYPEVSISFHVRDAASHYHVPLLLSPFGFTTYRGS